MADKTDVPEEFRDELESGRGEIQYAQVPAWVAFSVSPRALACYLLLKLSVSPGKRTAAPTREMLCKIAGLSVNAPHKITPFTDELAAIGAIDKRTQRRGMKQRTIYTVHFHPPKGFDGPITKRDWIAREFPDE